MSHELGALAAERAPVRTPSPAPPVYPPQSARSQNFLRRCQWCVATFAVIMLAWISLSNVVFWCAAAQAQHDYARLQNITAQVETVLPLLHRTLLPFQVLATTLALHQSEFNRAVANLPAVERNIQELLDVADDLARELAAYRSQKFVSSPPSLQNGNTEHHRTLPLWTEQRID